MEKGIPGQTYCFGGNSERNNLTVVKTICSTLDELVPRKDGASYETLISFVKDRLGHDFRYAIDDSKAQKDLGYTHEFKNFEQGLKQTIHWYLENQSWCRTVKAKGES